MNFDFREKLLDPKVRESEKWWSNAIFFGSIAIALLLVLFYFVRGISFDKVDHQFLFLMIYAVLNRSRYETFVLYEVLSEQIDRDRGDIESPEASAPEQAIARPTDH